MTSPPHEPYSASGGPPAFPPQGAYAPPAPQSAGHQPQQVMYQAQGYQPQPVAYQPRPNGYQPQQAYPQLVTQHKDYVPQAPAWTPPPRRGRAARTLAVVGISVGGLALLTVMGLFMAMFGLDTIGIATGLGLIPLVILVLAVRWIDRWEPEPWQALLFAFLWGAGASVALALVVDLGLQVATAMEGVSRNAGVMAITQAPFVEEIAKGIGVLLIALVARKHLDGPVDGVVYAAMIAAGFTFTEDILYFANTISVGSANDVVAIWVLRGLFSPFAHMMFTACTGLAVGLAVRRKGVGRIIGFWCIGLIPAMVLHGLWNAGAYFFSNFLVYYLCVQVPLFIMVIVLVVFLRKREQATTRARLEEYAQAGWFYPGEVTWLATARGRVQARAWARRQHGPRGDKTEAMRRFVRDATRLAGLRQRIISGRADISAAQDEQEMLGAITRDRAMLLG